jgi:hypothetical protein
VRLILPDDGEPGGSTTELRLYSLDTVGIPCPDNASAPLITPSSKVRVAYNGSIARYVNSKEVVVGSVWRSKYAALPGNLALLLQP